MSKEYDIIVVGAGILGAASAFRLIEKNPELKILLIDREGLAQGNTCRSVSMVRDTFTSPTSFALAYSSIQIYKEMHASLPTGIDLNRMMYLWLFNAEQHLKNLPAIEILKERGLDVELLDPAQLSAAAPGMEVAPSDEESVAYGIPPIASGLLCRDCYSVEPVAITQFYADRFREAGGTTRYGIEVVDLLRQPVTPLMFEDEEIPGQPFPSQKQKVAGVILADGETIEAETTILATGAWSRILTDKLGKDSLLSPKKRQWFYVESAALKPLFNMPAFGNEDGTIPFTIFPQSMYIKPSKEGGIYLALADDIGRNINLDIKPERNYFLDNIHPFIKAYFPQFENVTIKAMDAGSYCYDEVYRTPIVDWIHDGVMLVSGASGSGIMKADAIGRVAESRYKTGIPGDGTSEIEIELPGGISFDTNDLTIRGRGRIEPERLVI